MMIGCALNYSILQKWLNEIKPWNGDIILLCFHLNETNEIGKSKSPKSLIGSKNRQIAGGHHPIKTLPFL